MQINDKLHGFKVKDIRDVSEVNATLYEMEYEKNGVQLIWLKRDDSNKTFAISFKTIPSDDTGVFHIIEHTVLNGSDKYPVKEPFVELLKGSLQTFLNAMTYPDKTVYPVSSRNNQDFLNLIDVYMDAVFNPLIHKSPDSFYQEGWHYELFDKVQEPIYQGVVYNEMKGVFSSVYSKLYSEMNRLLFPDTCYGFESGGDPRAIPQLTYEQFLQNHRDFYHPTNARVFLDGDIDLDVILAKLDGYFSAYDRHAHIGEKTKIDLQAPTSYRESFQDYEISADEDEKNKAQIALGYVFGTFEDNKKRIALNILADVLCGTNDTPLKKAVIDKGLGEDAFFDIGESVYQLSALFYVMNTEEAKKDEIIAIFNSILSDLVKNGIDREQLNACLNSTEFTMREWDTGRYPRGLMYGLTMLNSWLYDGQPEQYLQIASVFEELRKGVDEGYFEKLLQEVFLDNQHKALVCMRPSKTAGEEALVAEKAALSSAKATWDEQKVADIITLNERLKVYQESENTKEQLDTIPQLELSEINPKPEKLPLECLKCGGSPVLYHDVETNGIAYVDLYFSAAGFSPEELSALSFLSELIGFSDTENYTALALYNQIKTHLGSFKAAMTVFSKAGVSDKCNPYLVVRTSVLVSKKAELVRLIEEILTRSIFTSEDLLINNLRQLKLTFEQNAIMNGHNLGAERVKSYFTAEGVVKEYTEGFEKYAWLKKHEGDFKNLYASLSEQLIALYQKIFTRERLTVSLTGKLDRTFVEQIQGALPVSGDVVPAAADYQPLGIRREGFVVPAGVAFAVRGGSLNTLNLRFSGKLKLAAKILYLNHLWNAIRVKGGAYGAAAVVSPNGFVRFDSYRDPNPNNSLAVYQKSGDFLRELAKGGESLDAMIIGTIAQTEPLMSPRLMGRTADEHYFSNVSYEDVAQMRSEILGATKADLVEVADILDKLLALDAICVVGGKDKLDACADKLERIQAL